MDTLLFSEPPAIVDSLKKAEDQANDGVDKKNVFGTGRQEQSNYGKW